MIALFVIPILAILPLLSSGYFSHHDLQHPVRLFLLKQAIYQGYIFPRWVGDLGFGFGYPLFNFYPPLIYYVALGYSALGFSLITSLKLMLITGFLLGTFGSYLYSRLFFSRKSSLLVALFFTYTFYHAITVYVRGAFAEFFSYSLFPFFVYFLHGLIIKPSMNKVIGLGVSFGLLILCHPLIAFPAIFFIMAYFLLAIFLSKKWVLAWLKMITGLLLGLSLSAFFWLPSIIEKRLTLVDNILTKELYSYRLHFIELKQLFYSPWGFGGSIKGTEDGISFQLGRYYLLFLLLSVLSLIWAILKKRQNLKKPLLTTLVFIFFLFGFSYFMSLNWSQFVWDKISYLWYLQFPWRFFTFGSFYLSLAAATVFELVPKIFKAGFLRKSSQIILITIAILLVVKYSQLFKPQTVYQTSDAKLTNLEQRQWVISRTSFEFVPKGVKTKKNEYGVTTLAIEKKDLPKKSFQIIFGQAKVTQLENRFQNKIYQVKVPNKATFQLNTYYFPGWQAFLNNQEIAINKDNQLQLITVNLPKGQYELQFVFNDTLVRKVGNFISWLSFGLVIIYFAINIGKSKQKTSFGNEGTF